MLGLKYHRGYPAPASAPSQLAKLLNVTQKLVQRRAMAKFGRTVSHCKLASLLICKVLPFGFWQ